MRELERCFQEAQGRVQTAEGQARSLLAANAELQDKTKEEYAIRQAAAARVADLEVREGFFCVFPFAWQGVQHCTVLHVAPSTPCPPRAWLQVHGWVAQRPCNSIRSTGTCCAAYRARQCTDGCSGVACRHHLRGLPSLMGAQMPGTPM